MSQSSWQAPASLHTVSSTAPPRWRRKSRAPMRMTVECSCPGCRTHGHGHGQARRHAALFGGGKARAESRWARDGARQRGSATCGRKVSVWSRFCATYSQNEPSTTYHDTDRGPRRSRVGPPLSPAHANAPRKSPRISGSHSHGALSHRVRGWQAQRSLTQTTSKGRDLLRIRYCMKVASRIRAERIVAPRPTPTATRRSHRGPNPRALLLPAARHSSRLQCLRTL